MLSVWELNRCGRSTHRNNKYGKPIIISFIMKKKLNNGPKGRKHENKNKWEDGYKGLETKTGNVPSPGSLVLRRTYCVNSTPICFH
jgi:hypothetical protein